MNTFLVLVVSLAAVSAAPEHLRSERIVGGSPISINFYPEMVSMLAAYPLWFTQQCAGTVLNNRAILSAANCYGLDPPSDWRIRLGTSFANSGGIEYFVTKIIKHPRFDRVTLENDIAILHTEITITFSNVVSPGIYASANYHLRDNEIVYAAGWGQSHHDGSKSEQLRHVSVLTVNQNICRSRYASIRHVSDNMLCSGWLDVGGRGQCQGDYGGPVYHHQVIVGISSWGNQCGQDKATNYPSVNTRVSRYSSWIQSNA